MQSKVAFICERIIGTGEHEDVHLLKLWVGNEEQLNLQGDSIAFSKFHSDGEGHLTPLALPASFAKCEPAVFLTIECVNRGQESRTISLSIPGYIVA